jgi:hypothetical protein
MYYGLVSYFTTISWREELYFDQTLMMSALHYANSFNFQSDTCSRFRANQSVLLLANDERLAEKEQIPILSNKTTARIKRVQYLVYYFLILSCCLHPGI